MTDTVPNAAVIDAANFSGVLAAYLSRNSVAPHEIPTVIDHLKTGLGIAPTAPAVPETPAEAELPGKPARKLTPKEIKDAIHDDGILCFEDGVRYKTMKRALKTIGLTPEQYRTKWGLPTDFPMTAPSYSAARRQIALDQNFGKRDPAAT